MSIMIDRLTSMVGFAYSAKDRVAIRQFNRSLAANHKNASDNSSLQLSNDNLAQTKNARLLNMAKDKWPWIYNLELKVDYEGPLTKTDKDYLYGLKVNLARQQHVYELQGSDEKAMPPWDDDGYPAYGIIKIAKSNLNNRIALNEKMTELLSSNSIFINESETIKITIDGRNKISVSGILDKEKSRSIETLLNSQSYGRRLVTHIINSTLTATVQCSGIQYRKYQTNNDLFNYLGIYVEDLSVETDGRLTIDGKDLYQEYRKAVNADKNISPEARAASIAFMNYNLNELFRGGIQNVDDMSIGIDYSGFGFSDLNTSYGYGYGQTDWIDKLMSLRGNSSELDKMSNIITNYDRCPPGWEHISLESMRISSFSVGA